MTENRIRVDLATDMERYLDTEHIVWFDEVPAAYKTFDAKADGCIKVVAKL